jgi:hypothetical protein
MSGSPSSSGVTGAVDIVGQMAGEYRLRRKVGEGAFGAVYEAEHPLLRRRAAVKVLHQGAGVDSQGVLRFISEAQAVNQVRNPYIIDIFSFGRLADGRHFYVMDYLDGEPLDAYLKRETRCSVPTALQLLRPLGEALDAAHAVGIIHRDLKPQNIFLSWTQSGDTVPKLLDFGTAKLLDGSQVHTMSGTTIGTPLYMSPEQARAEAVDARSDVYALGVLCHQLLTGELPITGSSTFAVLAGHIMTPPPRVSEVHRDLSPELDAPVIHMLQKDPNARPPTAGEALAELAKAAERAGYAVPAGPLRLPRPPPRPVDENCDTVEQTAPPTTAAGGTPVERILTPHPQRPVTTLVAARRGLSWPMMGLLAALGAALTYVVTTTVGPAARAPASAASLAVETAAPAASSAAVIEPPPRTIDVIVQGAPPEARVLLDGKVLGNADTPIALPHGEAPIRLMISAPGYEPATITVVPDKSSAQPVNLRKRATTASPRGVPRDLENPF